MNVEDYLFSCVEAGVALSGFAALALAIRSGAGRPYTVYERGMVATLVERGLVVALLALMPPLLESFGIEDETVWAVGSGSFILYGSSLVVRGIRARRQPDSEAFVSRRVFLPVFSAGVVVLLTQLLNIFPLGVAQGPQWFLLAITWLLVSAGYVFWFFLRAWVRAA